MHAYMYIVGMYVGMYVGIKCKLESMYAS